MNEARHRKDDRPPRAPGWTSLGLGAAQLAAPGAVRRLAGVDDSAWARLLVPLAGVRELCHAALRYSRWAVRGPAGGTVEWVAEIVEDRPGEVVAWRSSRGAGVTGGGEVRFADAPGRRGTEVRVRLRYEPPYRAAGATVARLLGEHPEQRVRDDPRRFEQVMETGEVVRSEGAPEGAHAMRLLRRRPARPVATGGAP
ncbi:SRPBCC family protein [Actinoallomurus iriomotensis]|uniref:Cyclase n=1 Tax=Actinoallomurus iriomotensis TaxID=478107 RepID=A0A9W6RGX4_9ACTN|nr:SRPBCC family protein [Actinoallomurus iriomotensis]GLY75871.1 hypothetical protein Airi01_041380 [Actinoallomurus iriomotensis]